MIRTTTLLLLATIILISCAAKKLGKNEFYFEDFDWTIKIPESFEKVKEETWNKVQVRGGQELGGALSPQFKTLFIYKTGTNSFIEANTEPHNGSVDDYNATIERTLNAFDEALHRNFPNAVINTTRTIETISGKDFLKFESSISTSPLHTIVYSRLFGKNRFTLSIMDNNEAARQAMLNTFRTSKFD
jgi:hypothetical protein